MPYIKDRVVHDADAHIMETDGSGVDETASPLPASLSHAETPTSNDETTNTRKRIAGTPFPALRSISVPFSLPAHPPAR